MKNKKHVLIVEDELYSFLYLKELLTKRNIKISRVNNGEDVINFININKVDIILMDIKLPGISGVDTTKILRNMGFNIPIIIQTACTFDYDRNSSLESGANEFITKPINCKELLFLVKKYIDI